MKELLLRLNLSITGAMLLVALAVAAFAVDAGAGAPGWYIYLVYGIIMEAAVWCCCGVGAIVSCFINRPPMRRGYIRYSEKAGWTDEWGYRP